MTCQSRLSKKGSTKKLTCESHVAHGVHCIFSNTGSVCQAETVVKPTEKDPSDPLVDPSYLETV